MIITNSFGQVVDQMKLANEYYLSKDYEKAAAIYKKLSKQTKNIQQIHTNYLDLMINNDKYDEAFSYIKRVLKVYPNEPKYRVDQIYVASLFSNQKEYKRLKKELHNLYQLNPNTLKKISEEFSYRKLYNDALIFLSHARIQSQDPQIYALDFAKIYNAIGNEAKMMTEYIKFASQQPRHVPYVKNILQELISKDNTEEVLEKQLISYAQKSPDNLLYNDLLMWLYIQKNDFYGAFVQAKAIDKKSKKRGYSVMQVAKVAFENQAYAEAMTFYDDVAVKSNDINMQEKAKFLSLLSQEKKITNEFPINKIVINKIAEAYQLFYEHTIETNSDRYDALKNKARLLAYHLNQTDTAIIILENLMRSPGMNRTFLAQVKMDLANIDMIVGNHWEASLLYSQIEKENNYASIGYEAKLKNARLHYFMSNFDLAKAHLDILKRSTSKEIANDALELSLFIETNTIGDSNEMGLKDYASISLLMYQNRFDEARNKLETLINTRLGHPIRDDSFWLLIKLETRLGKYKEAIKSLNILINEYSDGVLGDDALFMKAQILEQQLNNPIEAQQVYQQFLENFPGSAYAVEARRRYRFLRGDG